MATVQNAGSLPSRTATNLTTEAKLPAAFLRCLVAGKNSFQTARCRFHELGLSTSFCQLLLVCLFGKGAKAKSLPGKTGKLFFTYFLIHARLVVDGSGNPTFEMDELAGQFTAVPPHKFIN